MRVQKVGCKINAFESIRCIVRLDIVLLFPISKRQDIEDTPIARRKLQALALMA